MAVFGLSYPVTAAAFDEWALRPEHRDRRLELIQGEVVALVTQSRASKIAARILVRIGIYLEANDIGELTGADGGYMIGDDRYIPDVAFIRHDRQTHPPAAYYPVAPDLAVEVISNPENAQELHELRKKIGGYMAAGTVVWVVNPAVRTLEVYVPGQPPQILHDTAAVSGGDVLPGFEMRVQDVFPPQKD